MRITLINFKSVAVFFWVAIVFCFAPLTVLHAQSVESQPPTKELAEKNLEPFADAYKEVTQIHNSYEQRIVKSDEQAQVNALQQEANDKMSKAVTNHGLTVEDYNTIFNAIKNDPTLKEEFMTVLNRTP